MSAFLNVVCTHILLYIYILCILRYRYLLWTREALVILSVCTLGVATCCQYFKLISM